MRLGTRYRSCERPINKLRDRFTAPTISVIDLPPTRCRVAVFLLHLLASAPVPIAAGATGLNLWSILVADIKGDGWQPLSAI